MGVILDFHETSVKMKGEIIRNVVDVPNLLVC